MVSCKGYILLVLQLIQSGGHLQILTLLTSTQPFWDLVVQGAASGNQLGLLQWLEGVIPQDDHSWWAAATVAAKHGSMDVLDYLKGSNTCIKP